MASYSRAIQTNAGASASMTRPLNACDPDYPDWLLEHMREQQEYIGSLEPFPFDQPSDITGYYSLHQNDYLRLSHHPDVVRARSEANSRERIESFSSSVFGGSASEHQAFVELLRESMRAGEVIVTTAGWTANVGLIEAIVMPEMPVYIDSDAHASLVDGIRFSAGRRLMVRHNDPGHMEERVRIHGAGVIIVDALYSTDGTLSDIPRYLEIAERHNCVLVVDEAHSFGMFGHKGGGLAVQHGLAERVHFRTISLSKALGGHGGAVACGRDIGFGLCARMRSVLFSSSTSALLAAGHAKALDIVMSDPSRAARCLEMAALLRDLLEENGICTMGSKSQIISIGFKGDGACRLYGELRKRRILSSVFVYPAVPKGNSLVRFSVYAGLSESDIREIAVAVVESMATITSARDELS